LLRAVKIAQQTWGDRLIAAYALGSLAHGGFSINVSDVDLGLILADPLDDGDAKSVRDLADTVKTGGHSLSGWLSVFWGSPATLSGRAAGGRFPPLDRLDLKRYGRLLAGRDVRAQFPEPTLKELVISSAEFALRQLSRPVVAARLRDPVALARAETKPLTKQVLYPVRFLYTARTGDAGMNDQAVAHFLDLHDGAAAALASKALVWRSNPPNPGEDAVVEALRQGLLPLYRVFLADYEQRLRDYREFDLARRYREWRQKLDQNDETRGFPIPRE
jgi:hypothetical protein